MSIAAGLAGTVPDGRKLRPFWDAAGALRPPRPDIAVPPFSPEAEWLGGPAPRLERLVAAGSLLVHFLDFAQLNCLRALPYVREWHRRYHEHGLSVLAVHSPRFPFTRPAAAVPRALDQLQIEWPVAVDERMSIWRAYGCRGWPSLFLWGRGGTLRWHHLGEGDYDGTELAIRESLDTPGSGWPELIAPLRPSDAPGARVIAPTPEQFPGGSPEQPWSQGPRADPLSIAYEAGGAWAAVDGEGELRVILDHAESRSLPVARPGLVELADHRRHEQHRLELHASADLRVYSLQFAPAPARG